MFGLFLGHGNLTVAVSGYDNPLELGDNLTLSCSLVHDKHGYHDVLFLWTFIRNGTHKQRTAGHERDFVKTNVTEYDSGLSYVILVCKLLPYPCISRAWKIKWISGNCIYHISATSWEVLDRTEVEFSVSASGVSNHF